MKSKEFIENKINELEQSLIYAYELEREKIVECCQNEIKQYSQILKYLELLELLETELKLEKDKVKYVMGQLKKQDEILEILKKCEDEKHSLYCVNVLNALSSGKITQDDVIKVKEWLDNDK